MGGLIVQKYGGTSVGTPEKIHAVADRIAALHREGLRLVIVVSAMGHATDELIELAHRVSKRPPAREMDMLLTVGERVSMTLLSMALSDRGVSAISLTGSQSGIITDGSHRRARIRRILGDRVRGGLAEGKVVIVAGFQGVSESKEVTTLGRGGSDTTAVALASVLQSSCCEIYTDVDGVFSADPRKVPNARLYSEIGLEEMAEFSRLGAGVLHPRCVELAWKHRVPLKVINSMSTSACEAIQKGTQMIDRKTEDSLEGSTVSGVTADDSRFRVTVKLSRPGVMASFWSLVADKSLDTICPLFVEQGLHFFALREAEEEWREFLSELATQGFVASYQLDDTWVPLSVVGTGFAQDGNAIAKIFDTLAKIGIEGVWGGAQALSMTLAVKRTHAEDAVRALHEALIGPQSV